MIVQRIRPGCEEAYRQWSSEINTACSKFAGFVELEVFEPPPGQREVVLVLRFASEEEGAAWHNSSICLELLEQSKSFVEERVMRSPSRVFASWFGDQDASRESPRLWKDALTVLLVLYPTVMILTLYVTGPLLKGWSLATSMYLGNLLSVSILTWVLMPLATRWLAFWLTPTKGSRSAHTLLGLVLVLGLQALTVWFFHNLSK